MSGDDQWRIDDDPQPDCSHRWYGLGVTTICEPPVDHAICLHCRTFRHGRRGMEAFGSCAASPAEVWYSTEWMYPDSWDWDEFEARTAHLRRAGSGA